MKIISLNVNGIRDLTKRNSIVIFCKRKNADLIFLQETHSVDSDVKFWKSQWGDQGYFCHFSQQSAGVAILLDKKEFTWSNANRSLQSRIDLWFISPSSTHFVSETSHEYAPLSDHNLITIHLIGTKQKGQSTWLLEIKY